MERLEEGARFAREHGQVVVIGHDKSATIEAIRRSAPKLKREGIVFVKVTELLEKP